MQSMKSFDPKRRWRNWSSQPSMVRNLSGPGLTMPRKILTTPSYIPLLSSYAIAGTSATPHNLGSHSGSGKADEPLG